MTKKSLYELRFGSNTIHKFFSQVNDRGYLLIPLQYWPILNQSKNNYTNIYIYVKSIKEKTRLFVSY